MKITWVTRSFLDYRIPVFKALDEMCGHQLTVVYYKDIPPKRTQDKLKAVLGDRAIARERELGSAIDLRWIMLQKLTPASVFLLVQVLSNR